MRYWAFLCALLFTAALTAPSRAQTGAAKMTDTIALAHRDSLSGPADSAALTALEDSLGIRISPDALPAVVTATATDSAVLNMTTNLFFLYGDATVNYEDLSLKSDKVMYNQADNTISAEPIDLDSMINPAKRPQFKQGGESFTYDYMKYNFKSKRAIVRNSRTQYGEGFVHSEQVKRNPDNSIFALQSDYTTCSLDTPHFSLRARHAKIVPGHIIVAGGANLMIEGVPTPVFLPFGVFPISETQKSGFRIPSYTLEEARGLGLTNGGYYFHPNDYIDFLLLSSIFSKGSYNVGLASTYADRYHYNGGFSFTYAYNKEGEVYEPGSKIDKQFLIKWRHATDPKATPGQSFNASVDIQKGNFYADNSYNPNLIIQNQFQSNISYSKSWTGKPFSLTISALHNQNTATHIMNVTLPQMAFYVSQLTPFANKNRVGAAKWYEKISLSYTFNGLSQTSFYDTAFSLSKLGLGDFRTGFHHSIPVSASYTVLRYLNLSVNANYNEYWLTDKTYNYYNTTESKLDTIRQTGFFTARDFNASANLSTRLYGIKRWRTGRLAGIRHVLEGNVGLAYTPDFAAKPFGYYYQAYLTPGGTVGYYSPFADRSPVGVPGFNQYGHFASTINFGINNNLQIKTRSGSDTGAVTKNITLIDGLSLNSGYNLAADSFGWAGFSANYRTNILDKIQLSGSALFDPYVYDASLGRRVNKLAWDNGGLLNFQNANLSVATSFRSSQKGSNNTQTPRTDEATRLLKPGYDDYLDFKIPWSLHIAYNISLTKVYRSDTLHGDTLQYNQSALFGGDFNLSAHWKVTFSSGYDFVNKALTLTRFDIYRDLHCWEMRLGTFPFGPRKSYDFSINVKASVLQDLKLLRRRDYRDAL